MESVSVALPSIALRTTKRRIDPPVGLAPGRLRVRPALTIGLRLASLFFVATIVCARSNAAEGFGVCETSGFAVGVCEASDFATGTTVRLRLAMMRPFRKGWVVSP